MKSLPQTGLGGQMMEIKDIITLVVTVIVALIGVSSIAIYKYKKVIID